MQLSVVKALGQLGKRTQVSVSPLIEKLQDKDPHMRAQVVEALAKTKNKKASTALVKLLGGETDKCPIIWAIGEIGDKRAIPALNQLLTSDDRYVKYSAYRALAKIGTDQAPSDSNTRGLLDISGVVFQRYKYMMMVMFEKIEGFKRT
jgi:HEAT repeat protein